MEWTNAEVCNLISLFRNRPVLWDVRIKEYKDKNKKYDALLEIAASLGVDVQEVERKIKNLLCHFLREVKRERDSNKSGTGSGGVYKSKWFCFNDMMFLKDRNQSRRMLYTTAQDHKRDIEDIIEQDTQNSNLDQEDSEVASGSGRTRNKRLSKSPSDHPSPQKRQKPSANEEDLSIRRSVQSPDALIIDQYKSFGDQVGMRIRDLPSSNAQTIVKHLISNILFEAEMGNYNNINQSSAAYSQLFHPISTQYSVSMSSAYSNSNIEQPSHSGRTQTTTPQSTPMSPVHLKTDLDDINNI